MKLSFCTIAYRQTGETPEQVVDKVAALGFNGAEWWWNHVNALSAKRLKELYNRCSNKEIEIPGIVTPAGQFDIPMTNLEKNIENAKKAFEIAHLLGNCRIRVWAGWTGEVSSLTADDVYFNYNINGLQKISRLAEKEGLFLQLETHNKTLADSVKGIQRLIQGVKSDNFKLLMQIDDHCENSGVDEIGYWNAIKEYVVHIHFNPHENPAPGRDLQWKGLFTQMKEDGYKGFVSVESCHDPKNPDHDGRYGMERLRELGAAD